MTEKKVIKDKNVLFALQEPTLHYVKVAPDQEEYLQVWVKEPTWLEAEKALNSVMKIDARTQNVDIDINAMYRYMVENFISKTEPSLSTLDMLRLSPYIGNQLKEILPNPMNTLQEDEEKKRIVENAVRGKKTSPQTVFLVMTYTLASALSISPLEIYKMPSSLVMDLLRVHFTLEKIKHEEIEKAQKRQVVRVADDEVQKLAGNLSDLNKITLDAGIEFQGMAKKLIKMSDATSRAGKKWTIFSRIVSGSPIWKIQNKVRAFIDVLAQVEQGAQANAKAAKEQEQSVIDSVQAYESLKKPLEDAIKLRKLGNLIGHTLEKKHNKELKEAVKGTHAYNLARLQGVSVDKAVVKGLDEIIKKGKQQQKQFKVIRKQAKFEKDMQTAKGRAKISKDISSQVDVIKNRPRPQIKQGIAKTYLNATTKLDSLVQDIKKNGLIDAMGSTFGLISRAIKRSEKLQKLRIRVMLMLLVAFNVIKPVFSYLFKVLIIMMIVMGAIMLVAKIIYDTFDILEDLPFFLDLVKVVAGAILENLMLIFNMIGALLSGDMYTFIDYALDFVDNLLIIGLGLLGIALYGLLGLASGILYSLMDSVFRYFHGMLFRGENAKFAKTINKILLRGLMIFAAVYAVKQLAIMMLHVALTKGIYLLLPAMILVAVIAGAKFLFKTLKDKIPFFASGGVSAGGMAVVGERGPELVSLPKGARVHSNTQSKKMSSNVVNNNVSVTINAKDTSDAELRRIADQVGNMVTNKLNRTTSSSGFIR